jgi:hypothetical protein
LVFEGTMGKSPRLVLTLLALTLFCTTAGAGMINPYTFNGQGNWSIDGVGSNSTPVGSLSALVPTGSTVEKAYLYTTTNLNSTGTAPTVVFDGTSISGSSWASLGSTTSLNLIAFRSDVTSQVAATIAGGSGSAFSFTVNSESPTGTTDGEALVIIYSNPSEVTRTIAILDGNTDPAGDSASFIFSNPLTNPNAAGFEALMSLGIGFGFQPVANSAQYSTVDVNGSRLTSYAGGQDDGGGYDGGLITIGGIGDDPANPASPYGQAGGYTYDDELYDLRSYLTTGDTSFGLTTTNPSYNDNIFFVGLNITAEGRVDPNVVPVPSAALLGLGMLGSLAVVRRIRRRRHTA